VFFMAQFLQVALGHGPLDAGLRLLPWGIAAVVVAAKTGALAERLGERSVVVCGLVVHAIGLAWMALLARPGMAYGALVAPMIAAGAGFAMAIPVVQKTVIGAVAPIQIGKASGTLSMIRQLGGAFGLALTVAAFAKAGNHGSPQAFASGFAAANFVAAILSLAGAVAALWLPERRMVTPGVIALDR
jgi:Na+/melibiose symporter-like transporter